jgi:hypothetical protein
VAEVISLKGDGYRLKNRDLGRPPAVGRDVDGIELVEDPTEPGADVEIRGRALAHPHLDLAGRRGEGDRAADDLADCLIRSTPVS